MHKSQPLMRGITLIELVIVVSIISILAAFAYPSYVERTQRAKRTDAKAALLNIAGQQERFFFKNNTFADELADLGVPAATQNGYYTIALVGGTSTFLATATPADANSGQGLDERCTSFSIDQLGRKRATGPTGVDDISAECWR